MPHGYLRYYITTSSIMLNHPFGIKRTLIETLTTNGSSLQYSEKFWGPIFKANQQTKKIKHEKHIF